MDRINPPGIGLSQQEQARIARIEDELREGIGSLSDIGPAVSIFGSARSRPDSWEYRQSRLLGQQLAAEGIAMNLTALSEGYRVPDAPAEAKPFEIMITGFNHDRPW